MRESRSPRSRRCSGCERTSRPRARLVAGRRARSSTPTCVDETRQRDATDDVADPLSLFVGHGADEVHLRTTRGTHDPDAEVRDRGAPRDVAQVGEHRRDDPSADHRDDAVRYVELGDRDRASSREMEGGEDHADEAEADEEGGVQG